MKTRVNVTIESDLVEAARAAGLNISQVCERALARELADLNLVDAAYRDLAALDERFGPPSAEEIANARVWADRILGRSSSARHPA